MTVVAEKKPRNLKQRAAWAKYLVAVNKRAHAMRPAIRRMQATSLTCRKRNAMKEATQ